MLGRCPVPLSALAAALVLGVGGLSTPCRADVLMNNETTSNTPTVALEYTLTTTQAIPALSGSPPAVGSSDPTTPQVVALVTPASLVQPGSSSDSALRIYSDSTGFYIKNPQDLSVGIGNNPPFAAGGTPQAVTDQALGLSFYGNGQGLPAGASLTFSLNFDKGVVGDSASTIPQLVAVDPSTRSPLSYIQIKYDGLAPGTGTGTGGDTGTGTGSGDGSGTTSGSGGDTGDGGTVTTPEPLSVWVWSALAGVGLWRAKAGTRRRRVRQGLEAAAADG